MNRLSIFIFFAISIVSCTNYYRNKEKVLFTLNFGSCFEADKVSLYINNDEIFRDKILTTNDVLSVTSTHLSYNNLKILTLYDNNETVTKEIILKENFTIKTVLNDEIFKHEIEINHGKYIMIDGCGYKINLHQYNKKIIID